MKNEEIISYLKQAAASNDPDAQYNLAVLYRSGQYGLPQDYEEAKRLTCLAARQGHQGAREWIDTTGPRAPIAKWLYVRGGVWDKFRKVVSGS